LLQPAGTLSAEAVLESVADSARFDVLQLGEAAMRGHPARALRILEGLRAEAVDATLALWAVNKDLQWIARAQYLMRRGQNADSAMNTLFVWKPRQPAMKQALARLNRAQVRTLLLTAERVDRAIKGLLSASDPWLELEALVAGLSGAWLRSA
jgi:DNA polymerase-3 subunit delta